MNAEGHKKINKLYENVGYFDSYGGSVLGFLFLTFCIFLIWSYYMLLLTKDAVKEDWVNQRCSPKVIPFAGWINKPDDDNQTPLEFTSENFQFCTQSILTNMMGMILSPFNALLTQLTTVFTNLSESTDQSRGILATLRENVAAIAKNVMNRILGVMIPLQQMLLAFTDSLAKTQAIMTSGLYTMLGSYYTLQSLMGAILEMIIKMLVSLAVIIVGLWIVPFTWPAAAASTAVFLSISVPLSLIAMFMTEVLHVHSAGIPKIPSCFDVNTPIQMKNGSFQPICKIKTGDVLFRGETVTATMQLARRNTDMYFIPNTGKKEGIIVSGSHSIQKETKFWYSAPTYTWMLVKNYPGAVLLPHYSEPVIYCFNTTNKLIHSGTHIFCDWDELIGDGLEAILNIPIHKLETANALKTEYKIIGTTERIHEYCDLGLSPDTQIPVVINGGNEYKYVLLSNILLGDSIIDSGYVYGIVDVLNTNEINKPLKHLLTTKHTFFVTQSDKKRNKSRNKQINDYNYNINGLLFLKK